MPGISNYLRNRFWNRVLRGPAAPSVRPGGIWLALFTTIPDDDGAGGVEPPGYSRVQITQVDGNWTAALAGAIDLLTQTDVGPAGVGGWPKIIGAGLYDAATVGNQIVAFPLVGSTPDFRNFAYNGSNAFQIRDHPFAEDDPVFVFGDNLPAPLVPNTEYYIKDSGTHVIKFMDAPGGSIITITGVTGGVVSRSGAVTIAEAQSFRFKANDLSLAIIR